MSEYNYRGQYDNPYYEDTSPKFNMQKPVVTYTLIAVNVLIYAIMTIVGQLKGWNQNEQLFYFGAKVNLYIDNGQYWRLITCMFLHVGIVHLLCNCYAIYIYGPIVERLYGRARYLAIYFISGLMGSLLSYLLSPAASAGASGAIFGLIGCMFYFRKRHKDLFKRIFGWNLFLVLGLNLFLGFAQSGIDNFGHIGGFIGGFIAAHLVGLYGEKVNTSKRVAAGLVLVFLFTGCFALKRVI